VRYEIRNQLEQVLAEKISKLKVSVPGEFCILLDEPIKIKANQHHWVDLYLSIREVPYIVL